MPYELTMGGNESRINFTGLLTYREIEELAENSKIETLQFHSPVDPRNWPRLEQCLFSKRPDIALRIYSHPAETCDLTFVQEMPSLQRFVADCLTDVSNADAIAKLEHLRELSIGVYELKSFDFLHVVSDKLEVLHLERLKSKRSAC